MIRLTKILAAILITSVLAPAPLLLVPRSAHAAGGIGDIVFDPTNWAQTTVTAANTTISAIAEPISAAANASMWVNQNVFMPLAFIMSGQLLKVMTAAIVGFVAGQVNGSGVPQFVQNLQGNLQQVGDSQAFSFMARFSKNSNSPFAASINSSLRTNYLQQTSLAGYFAQNKDTLPKYASNPNAYLTGDWSKGGVGAWFALTTQDNNNPYTKKIAAESALNNLVSNAQEARKTELNWAQGFLSWCEPVPDVTAADLEDRDIGVAMNGGELPKGTLAGDACTNEDGTPGTIKTPGSTIKSYLDRALGSNFGKLEGLGQLSSQVNGILGNVATIMSTVNFAEQVLGGGSGGGLTGVVRSGPGGTSVLTQYRNSPGYLGATQASVYQDSTNLSPASGDKASLLSQYESAWGTIRSSADAASTSLQRLITTCAAAETVKEEDERIDYAAYRAASAAQITDARSALANTVAPVLAQAASAFSTIADARALMVKLSTEVGTTDYSADFAKLNGMPPSITDVATARQQTQAFGFATASPGGSLNVSGGSIVDRMNLISSNADALQNSVCAVGTYRTSGPGSGSDG